MRIGRAQGRLVLINDAGVVDVIRENSGAAEE